MSVLAEVHSSSSVPSERSPSIGSSPSLEQRVESSALLSIPGSRSPSPSEASLSPRVELSPPPSPPSVAVEEAVPDLVPETPSSSGASLSPGVVLSPPPSPLSVAVEEAVRDLEPATPPPFSRTGLVDERIIGIAKRINPKRAFCNCGVVAYKEAHLLEHGEVATRQEMNLRFPNRPRPTEPKKAVKKWPKLTDKLPANRGYLILDNLGKGALDLVMDRLGPKTHAIVSATYAGALGKVGVGHCWNYILNKEGEREPEFMVLDAYRPEYTELGLRDPGVYFRKFQNSIDAVIFYEKTPENVALAARLSPPSK